MCGDGIDLLSNRTMPTHTKRIHPKRLRERKTLHPISTHTAIRLLIHHICVDRRCNGVREERVHVADAPPPPPPLPFRRDFWLRVRCCCLREMGVCCFLWMVVRETLCMIVLVSGVYLHALITVCDKKKRLRIQVEVLMSYATLDGNELYDTDNLTHGKNQMFFVFLSNVHTHTNAIQKITCKRTNRRWYDSIR